MNTEKNCAVKGNDEDAILKFFVSKSADKDLGVDDVDRNTTILAYKILYDYWKNKKMVLLDPIFIGKVRFSGLIKVGDRASHKWWGGGGGGGGGRRSPTLDLLLVLPSLRGRRMKI